MSDVPNTAIDSESVKNCWFKIKSAKGSDFFVDCFYQSMFEHHPETLALFPDNLFEQKTKLLNTLDNVINGIDYLKELETSLIELGQLHKNLGIKKEMFDAFVTVITDAAKVSSDNQLTFKELNAWKNAFREISNIMLQTY